MSYVPVPANANARLWEFGNPPTKGRGFGDVARGYQASGDWSWMFYPAPFDFLAPKDSTPQPAPTISGFSGCGCGGKCGGCGDHGVGQATGVFGSGLFSSTDISQWGIGEWALVGVGLYVAGSIFGDVKSGVGSYRGRKR